MFDRLSMTNAPDATPPKSKWAERGRQTTLSELLFPLSNENAKQELEQFRIEYEMAHGLTDLSKRYTSTWPEQQRQWLVEHETRRYFDGLPPFAKAYIKGKVMSAANVGKLDDVPDCYLKLFLQDEMRLDPPRRGYPGW